MIKRVAKSGVHYNTFDNKMGAPPNVHKGYEGHNNRLCQAALKSQVFTKVVKMNKGEKTWKYPLW